MTENTPGDGIFKALDTERTNHKRARKDVVKWREKYFAARNSAAWWEVQARKLTEKLEDLQAQLDRTNR